MPFKLNPKRPVSSALYRCYTMKEGKNVSYRSGVDEYDVTPNAIYEDTIDRRILLKADQVYPVSDFAQWMADELLEEKLEENRNNPALRNIISTLQRKQFEIIDADISKSFVVQGCAGSGKSQCLFHRLFYLRDILAENNWKHVLLLTPTRLFQNYSQDLMRRYQLSDIVNCSMTEMYQDILNAYDGRFKDRQYIIVPSEEYLPDGYMEEVYSTSFTTRMERVIRGAIRSYANNACDVMGMERPERNSAIQIKEIQKKLDNKIRQLKEQEAELTRKAEIIKGQKRQLKVFQNDLNEFKRQRDVNILNHSILEEKINLLIMESGTDDDEKETGNMSQGKYSGKTLAKLEKKKRKNERNKKKIEDAIIGKEAQIEELVRAIPNQEDNLEADEIRRKISRVEKISRKMMRIESDIFENEVWRLLVPLKEKYDIPCSQKSSLKEGHLRETKILYKSDLVFYIMIYACLYPNENLPDYRWICIDEGQDLYEVDYQVLHCLYPRAVFNVFGDTEQVLRTTSAMRSWVKETGIDEVYQLNKNYRNTASLVEFCNQKFASSMEYIGKIRQEEKPHMINSANQMRRLIGNQEIVFIVKNRDAMNNLCASMHMSVTDFAYIDTAVEQQPQTQLPCCYSIYAAKGLEFSKIAVYAKGMTNSQRMVACTRATKELYYYE